MQYPENNKNINPSYINNIPKANPAEELAYGEDELTEIKHYIFPLTKDQEKQLKRQYIGFLNSHGRRIYIGIDDHKIIKGVVLIYKNCYLFRNRLVGYSNDFFPKCRLDKIKVLFQ